MYAGGQGDFVHFFWSVVIIALMIGAGIGGLIAWLI